MRDECARAQARPVPQPGPDPTGPQPRLGPIPDPTRLDPSPDSAPALIQPQPGPEPSPHSTSPGPPPGPQPEMSIVLFRTDVAETCQMSSLADPTVWQAARWLSLQSTVRQRPSVSISVHENAGFGSSRFHDHTKYCIAAGPI